MNRYVIIFVLAMGLALAACTQQQAHDMAQQALAGLTQKGALQRVEQIMREHAVETPCIVATNDIYDPAYNQLQPMLEADNDSLAQAESDALISNMVTLPGNDAIVICNPLRDNDSLPHGFKVGRKHTLQGLLRGMKPCFTARQFELFSHLNDKEALARVIEARLEKMSNRTRRDKSGTIVMLDDDMSALERDIDVAVQTHNQLQKVKRIALVHCDYVLLPQDYTDGSFDSGYIRATVEVYDVATMQVEREPFKVYAANSERINSTTLIENLEANLARQVQMAMLEEPVSDAVPQ